MKIGLAGPSGSGKSTLARYIAELTGVEYFEGSAGLNIDLEDRHMLEREFGYKPNGHKEVIRLSNENPAFGLAFQTALAKNRAHILMSKNNFVTDRTPLDNASYFLMQNSAHQPEGITGEFLSMCVSAAVNGLSHLIIVRPNEGWTEDNDSRVANNFYQHMTYSVFYDTYMRYFKDRLEETNVKVLSLYMWDLELRKSKIEAFLSEPYVKKG
jgi:energy-coupling factor transporter ATP-binding protein EcfA2